MKFILQKFKLQKADINLQPFSSDSKRGVGSAEIKRTIKVGTPKNSISPDAIDIESEYLIDFDGIPASFIFVSRFKILIDYEVEAHIDEYLNNENFNNTLLAIIAPQETALLKLILDQTGVKINDGFPIGEEINFVL